MNPVFADAIEQAAAKSGLLRSVLPPPRPRNFLHLIRLPDMQISGHGGSRTRRTFVLYLNGHRIERFADHAAPDYNSGDYLDRHIRDRVAVFERALGCKAIRGRASKEP